MGAAMRAPKSVPIENIDTTKPALTQVKPSVAFPKLYMKSCISRNPLIYLIAVRCDTCKCGLKLHTCPVSYPKVNPPKLNVVPMEKVYHVVLGTGKLSSGPFSSSSELGGLTVEFMSMDL
jgi:hypothetical protein